MKKFILYIIAKNEQEAEMIVSFFNKSCGMEEDIDDETNERYLYNPYGKFHSCNLCNQIFKKEELKPTYFSKIKDAQLNLSPNTKAIYINDKWYDVNYEQGKQLIANYNFKIDDYIFSFECED